MTRIVWEILEQIENNDDLYVIHFYLLSSNKKAFEVFKEAKQRGQINLGNSYSVSKHKPHTPKNQYHLHLYLGNNEISSINMDGSGHDNWTGSEIPNSILPDLKNKFPKFNWKENTLKESVHKTDQSLPFNEDFSNIKTYYFSKFT